MSSDYKVIEVSPDPSPWSGQHGSFVDYWINVSDGLTSRRALNTRKAESAPPKAGDVIYGSLEEKTSKKGNTYYKLHREQRPDDAPAPAFSTNGRKGGGDPDRERRIQRQHSQEMALRLLAVRGESNPSEEALRKLIDWFQQDIGNKPDAPETEPDREPVAVAATETPGDDPEADEDIPF